MAEKRLSVIRTISIILIALVLFLSLAQTVRAQGIIIGSTLPAGQVVENDAILIGDDLTLDGTVVGDVLAIGKNVTINGTVNGSLIAIGQTVKLGGAVDGTTYSSGLEVTLLEGAELARNLYILSGGLYTQPGSMVGRDLYAAVPGGGFLQGTVGRNNHAIIGPLPFVYMIMNLINGQPVLTGYQPAKIGLDSPVYLSRLGHESWLLTAAVKSTVSLAGISRLAPSLVWRETNAMQAGGVDWAKLGDWLLARLREAIGFLIFGLLVIWLWPGVLTRGTRQVRVRPWAALGIGLLWIAIAFNLIFVAFLLALVVLVIGIGLATIGLWGLAWAIWVVGFSALFASFAIFWLFVIYGSKAVTAYLIGMLILEPLAPKATRYKVIPMSLGLVLYALVAAIPYVGWIVGLAATAYGLGAAWYAWRSRHTQVVQTSPEAESLDTQAKQPEILATETQQPEILDTEEQPESIETGESAEATGETEDLGVAEEAQEGSHPEESEPGETEKEG